MRREEVFCAVEEDVRVVVDKNGRTRPKPQMLAAPFLMTKGLGRGVKVSEIAQITTRA